VTAAPRCPACGGSAVEPEQGRRHHAAHVAHVDGCPVAADVARQDADDLAWLSARGPGAVRLRHLSFAEAATIAMLSGGVSLPRSIAADARVRVVQVAPRVLLHAVEYDGTVRLAAVIVVPDEAAAAS